MTIDTNDEEQLQQAICELLSGDLGEGDRLAVLRSVADQEQTRQALREALEIRQVSQEAFGVSLPAEQVDRGIAGLMAAEGSNSTRGGSKGGARRWQIFAGWAVAATVLLGVAVVWHAVNRGQQSAAPPAPEAMRATAPPALEPPRVAPPPIPEAARVTATPTSGPSPSDLKVVQLAALTDADVRRFRETWRAEAAADQREPTWVAMGTDGSRSGSPQVEYSSPPGIGAATSPVAAPASIIAVRCLLVDPQGGTIDRRDLLLRPGSQAAAGVHPGAGLTGQIEIHDRLGGPLMVLMMVHGESDIGWGIQGQVTPGSQPLEIGHLRLDGLPVRLIVQAMSISL